MRIIHPIKRFNAITVLMMWVTILSVPLGAQQAPVTTQYFNNSLVINPAFAGTRNALAIDMSTRQQWMGMKEAPRTYYVVAHTPINRSKISVGAALMSDQAGPVRYNTVSLAYSYLARINHRTFVSLGLNTGFNNFGVGLQDLKLNDANDPYFSRNISNSWKPAFGTGLVVFTPAWYLSFSIPQIPLNRYKNDQNEVLFGLSRNYYLSAGYYFLFADGYNLKLSTMSRFTNQMTTHDINGFFTLKDFFNVGLTYRFKSAMAITLGTHLTREISIFYSYDFPISDTKYNSINAQELTLSFDISKYFVRNRDREFLRKNAAEELKSIKSIRYF